MKRQLVAAALTVGLIAGNLIQEGAIWDYRPVSSYFELPADIKELPRSVLPQSIGQYATGQELELVLPPVAEVNLDVLPAALPDGVRKRKSDAVVVSMHEPGGINNADAASAVQPSRALQYGSGVRVGNNLYLTAGHLVRNDDGSQIGIAETCGLCVETTKRWFVPGLGGTAVGQSVSVDEGAGIFRGSQQPSPDIALVDTEEGEGTAAVSRQLSVGTAVVGEVVYFVNYKPTKDGVWRSPYQIASLETIEGVPLDEPAVYGGVVVKRESSGDLVVVEGLKSYSADPDAFGRKGMSGGPVYDADGRLIGICVRVVEEPMEAETVGQLVGVKLTGVEPKQKVSFTAVQPVTEKLLDELLARLDEAPDCGGPAKR